MSLPILLYSVEALSLNKTEMQSLDFPLRKDLFKIFKVSSSDSIEYCRQIHGVKTINELYIIRRTKFIEKINTLNNVTIRIIAFGDLAPN